MFSTLPNEIIEIISKKLDPISFVRLKSTSKNILSLLSSYRFYQNATAKSMYVCDLVINKGKSVFITGPGGCGKTFTLNEICKQATKKGLHFAITATTGYAATNFEGGTTIHSFSGLGLAKISLDQLIDNFVEKNSLPGRNRWNAIDILIIDEISMLSASLLEKLDFLAKMSRGDERPFGGIQLVFSGDFLQLPPVGGRYAFTSPLWDTLDLFTVVMDIPVRQCDDIYYFRFLNKIRTCKYNDSDLQLLSSRVLAYKNLNLDSDMVKPTRIYCKNKDVEALNNIEFNKLVTPIESTNHSFDEIIERVTEDNRTIYRHSNKISIRDAQNKIESHLIRSAPNSISFREGAQYILTYNLNVVSGFVNGSRCVYVGEGKFRFMNDREIYIEPHKFVFPLGNNLYLSRIQYPLRLGYAVTIHSSQGMSLDHAIINIGKDVFMNSQIYVALSRVRRLDCLYIIEFDKKRIRSSKHALEFYKKITIS